MKKDQAYSRSLERYKNRIITQAKWALDDDVGSGDITTNAVIQNKSRIVDAYIITRSKGVLCGLLEAKEVLEQGGLKFQNLKMEGDQIRKGETIAKVKGEVCEILMRERTALNYLQILSGIATSTYKLVKKYPRKVASLRKTHPGLSYSEKRAIQVGGGFTHRLGLYDGFLIKDNHLATIVKELFGNELTTEEKKIDAIKTALIRTKKYREMNDLQQYFIEVEVESLKQAITAAKLHKQYGIPDMILLDNLKPHDVRSCVKAIRDAAGGKILIEASGGITFENMGEYIEAGVDIISTSEITLSAKPLDIGMKIVGYT